MELRKYIVEWFYTLRQKIELTKSSDLVLTEKKGKSRYRDLAPTTNPQKIDEYFSALDWAFNNTNVHNIAISGPYGAGKSSVINAYISKHPELKCINVSLADFVQTLEGKDQLSGDFDENELERGFLKQLFYKVGYSRIPQSRYRKLHPIRIWKIFSVLAIFLGVGVLSAAFLFDDLGGKITRLMDNVKTNLNLKYEWTGYVVLFIVLIVFLGLLAKGIWFVLSRLRIKEIGVSDKAQAKLGEESESVIFNKNLDEIVYFFEMTKYNVVFIEDLDRFKTPKIFVRLRELNTILNNYDEIKKRIVFVYAIRDDMFSNTDRTKFFEFILPVIPYVNSTNSGEIFQARIDADKKLDSSINLDSSFIEMVSSYIGDMRVLDNIYNEFITYKETLKIKQNKNSQELKLKDEMMLALMIFKNLYPKDFADLQSEKGIVKEAFAAKKTFITTHRNRIELEKNEIAHKIKQAEEGALKNLREVKNAMLYYMTGQNGMFRYIHSSSGVNFDFNTILKEEFDIEKLSTKGTVYYWKDINNNYYSTGDYSFDAKKEFVGDFDYIERCGIIKLRLSEEKEKSVIKIEQLTDDSDKVGKMSLQVLIGKYGAQEILPKEVWDNKLLVFLLRNGYIDENYANYMNYFHENSISMGDMNFLLSIRNHAPEKFSFALTNVAKIIEKIQLPEFEQIEVLNFDLLNGLFETNEHLEKRILFLSQLTNETENSWQFINEYFDRAIDPRSFIMELIKYWDGMWKYIFERSDISDERKDQFLRVICSVEELKYLLNEKNKGALKKYFENNANIFNRIVAVPIPNQISIIEYCDMEFDDIDTTFCYPEVLEWIFENGKYKLSIEMIRNIFAVKCSEKKETLLFSNYTACLALGYKPLLDKIDKNISFYVRELVLGIESNTNESLDAVLTLINKELDISYIRRIIEKEKVTLLELDKCFEEGKTFEEDYVESVWNAWITSNKLQYSWENINTYWDKFGVTTTFNQYLENAIWDLGKNITKESVKPQMLEEIIKSNLPENILEKLLNSVCVDELVLNLDEINVGHMKVLLTTCFFEFTENFAKEVRSAHPTLYVYALETNHEIVSNNIDKYCVSETELHQIIDNGIFTDKEILKMIEDNDISFTEKIAQFISVTKESIDVGLFWEAFELLDEHKRYYLLIKHISILNNDEIAKAFSGLGAKYQRFAIRSCRHVEKIEDTVDNRMLANHLKQISYITSYEESNFKVYDDTKKRVVTKPAILCRVKKVV